MGEEAGRACVSGVRTACRRRTAAVAARPRPVGRRRTCCEGHLLTHGGPVNQSVGRDAALLYGQEEQSATRWPASMQSDRGQCSSALLQPGGGLGSHRHRITNVRK
nr:uncharacterized protein LOC117995743 [Maniola hyperantus]